MLVIAHRGYHADVPENTLEAFRRAASLDLDGIETDLRLSADGQVVLFHDHLAPAAPGEERREVGQLTRDELSAAAGYDVPTLEAALESSPNLLWLLEIKTPAALGKAVATIGKFLPSKRMLVISFWHNVVQAVRGRLAVDCGVLVCHRPLDSVPLYPASDKVRTLVWNYEFMDEAILEHSRGAGWRNFVYGVTTAAEHARCAQWSLDGVITDYPLSYS